MEYCKKNCKYLFPTEEQQIDNRDMHWCRKYKVRLFHGGHHPEICKYNDCENKTIDSFLVRLQETKKKMTTLKKEQNKLLKKYTELLEVCKKLLTNCPSPEDIEFALKAIVKE